MSRRQTFFQVEEEQGNSWRSSQGLVQIRLTEPESEAVGVVRSVLREAFGTSVDAAFVTRDREQVFAYVADLTDPVLEAVFAAEQELSKGLRHATELRLVAHQGHHFPSEQPGMDRAI